MIFEVRYLPAIGWLDGEEWDVVSTVDGRTQYSPAIYDTREAAQAFADECNAAGLPVDWSFE